MISMLPELYKSVKYIELKRQVNHYKVDQIVNVVRREYM